ncbi:MAG: hypothetical protein ACFBRM_04550 [Pikeienuella sp.]
MSTSVEQNRTELTEQQKSFLENHLLKRKGLLFYKKKTKSEIAQKYGHYIKAKGALLEVIGELPEEKQAKHRTEVKKVEENLAKSGKSLDLLRLAMVDLGKINVAVNEDLKHALVEKFDKSPQGQIAAHQQPKQQEMRQIVDEVTQLEQSVLDKLQKIIIEKGVNIDPPSELNFSRQASQAQVTAVTAMIKVVVVSPDEVKEGKKAIDEFFQTFETKITEIKNELTKLLNDTDSQEKLVDNRMRCARMEEQLEHVADVCDDLIRWAVPIASGLKGQGAELSKLVDPQADEAVLESAERQLRALVMRVDSEKSRHVREYLKTKQEYERKLRELVKGAEIYNEELSKKGVKKEQVDEASFLLQTARIALDSGANPDVFNAVQKVIDDGAAWIGDLQKISTINPAIEQGIKDAHKTLDKHKEKKTIRPEAWKGHREWLAEFEPDWVNRRPATALEEIQAFQKRLEKEEDVERQQKEWRDYHMERLKSVKPQLDEIAKMVKKLAKDQAERGDKVIDYDGALKRDYEMALNWIETKEALSWQTPIMQKVTKVREEILDTHAALNGEYPAKGVAEKALLDEYDRVKEAKDDAKSGKATIILAVENWLTLAKKDAKASPAYKDYKKDQYDPLWKRVNQLKKDIKKNVVSPEDGDKQLKMHEKTLRDLLSRSPKIDRGKLGLIKTRWDEAVKNLETNNGTLRTAIDDAKIEDGAGAKVESQVTEVVKAFRTGGAPFEDAAKTLSSDSSSASARLRAREQALAAVRASRDQLNNDPLVAACVDNPFGVSGFASDVYRKLKEIELEVLRGV